MRATTPTVSERALRMLELIARADEPPTLNELMAQLDLAKATTHRFASLLERLGFVRRTADGAKEKTNHSGRNDRKAKRKPKSADRWTSLREAEFAEKRKRNPRTQAEACATGGYS